MGLRNRNIFTDENCFFVTTRCYEKRFLFVDEACFKILLDNFKFYNQRYKARTLAYVLMNNHIHFIVFFLERNHLSNYLRDCKKYTAIQLREHLTKFHPELVEPLRYEHRTQHYKVWQDKFDDVALFSKKVCETKVNYIHENPVRAGIVDDPVKYRYSSAPFYWNWHPGIQSELLHYADVF